MRLSTKYVIRSPLYAFFITTIVCNVSATNYTKIIPNGVCYSRRGDHGGAVAIADAAAAAIVGVILVFVLHEIQNAFALMLLYMHFTARLPEQTSCNSDCTHITF